MLVGQTPLHRVSTHVAIVRSFLKICSVDFAGGHFVAMLENDHDFTKPAGRHAPNDTVPVGAYDGSPSLRQMETTMELFLTGPTALAVIRAARRPNGPILEPCDRRLPSSFARLPFPAERVGWLLDGGATRIDERHPLHLLVPRAGARRIPHAVLCHVCTRMLPAGSFLHMCMSPQSLDACGLPSGLQLFVDAPALCMVHISHLLHGSTRIRTRTEYLAFIRLAGLAGELCGTYARSPESLTNGPMAWNVQPVLSTEYLKAYLARISHMQGLPLMRIVAAMAGDGHASPMETLWHLVFTCPASLGGIGLGDAHENEPLDIPGHLAHHLAHGSMRPDFFWPHLKVAVEYQGQAFHGLEPGYHTLVEDSNRIQDYASLGITCLTITYEDTRTAPAMERCIERILIAAERRAGRAAVARSRAALRDDLGRHRRSLLVAALCPSTRAAYQLPSPWSSP